MGLLVVWFPKTLYGTQDVIFRVGVYGAAVVLVMNTFFVSQKIRFQRLIENFECMFGKVYAPLHCDMLDHVLKTVPKGDATRCASSCCLRYIRSCTCLSDVFELQ